MEKKLNVGERLIILQMLPKEGNFTTLKIIRDLVNKVGISAEEYTEFGVEQISDKVTWNLNGSKEKAIDFKQKEIEVISDVLEDLDKASKLEFKHFSLFEKFRGD